MIDLIYRQDGGRRPEVIISDTGSYSDMVCGLMRLLGFDYRPQLADLPDAKLWRINPGADYGPLATAARGQHRPRAGRRALAGHPARWPARSTPARWRARRLRMLAHGGNPTQLGEAMAHYGRIFKTLHVLVVCRAGGPTARRSRACATCRKAVTTWPGTSSTAAGRVCAAPTTRAWRTSSARSGLVLNCITLWNTVYLTPRSTGCATRAIRSGQDVARLSAYLRGHVNVHGHYSFVAPTRQGLRMLRDPDAAEELT